MKYILTTILLTITTVIANGQGVLVPFAVATPTDTAYAAESLRIDSTIRFLKYATQDTSLVLGFDASGKGVLRSALITIDNINQLINYQGASKQLFVSDTSRGGYFYYSTSSSFIDSGTVFPATGKGSGRWIRVYNRDHGINVDWYGAIGDGVTDNYTLFNRLFNTGILKDSSKVYFGYNKAYVISSNIFVRHKYEFDFNNCTIRAAFGINASFNCVQQMIIKNGTFDGVYISFLEAGANYSEIHNCKFVNPTYPCVGINGGSSTITDVVVDKCQFFGEARGPLGTAFYPGIQVTGNASNVSISRCFFLKNVAGVTADGAGLNSLVDNIHIYDCAFDSMSEYACKFETGNHLSFTHNIVKNSSVGAILSSKNGAGFTNTGEAGRGYTVSNNTFINVNAADFEAGGCVYWITTNDGFTDFTFSNNSIYDCNLAVNRTGGGKLTVDNNTFDRGYSLVYMKGIVGTASITNNRIRNTYRPPNPSIDFDGDTIIAAIVLSTGTTNGTTDSVMPIINVENNVIGYWYDNAIQVARTLSASPNVRIAGNTFFPDSNSFNAIAVTASSQLSIFNNSIIGTVTATPMNFVAPSRILGAYNRYDNNSWQYINAMPTTGNHIKNEFIKNSGVTATGPVGWLRITNGSANVLGTDWISIGDNPVKYSDTILSFSNLPGGLLLKKSSVTYALFTPSSSASSGANTLNALGPVIAQSGTASYTAFTINPTETSLGSGSKLIQDWRVNDVRQASMSNTGSFAVKTIANLNTVANSTITMGDAGASVSRSMSDANPVWIMNNTRGASTGDFWNSVNSVGAIVAKNDISGNMYFTVPNNTLGNSTNILVSAGTAAAQAQKVSIGGSIKIIGTVIDVNDTNVVYSATTLTMTARGHYTYTGSAASTWTLPAIAGNTGVTYKLYNRGTAAVTVNTNGASNVIYSGGTLVNTITIAAGDSYTLYNDGTYWLKN